VDVQAFEELLDDAIDFLRSGFREKRPVRARSDQGGTDSPDGAVPAAGSDSPAAGSDVPPSTAAGVKTSDVPAAVHSELAGFSLPQLHEQILGCTRCRLSSGRNLAVPGEGDHKADILLIGEGPGAEEDRQGKPFVGRAGQLLTKMLAAIQLTREEVFITNIVKCRPPRNRNPLPDEAQACFPYLKRQIELIAPRIIMCLGGPAAQRITGSELGITRLRGSFHTFMDYPVLATYHPAAVLRFPDKYKRPVWNDLKMLRDFYRDVRGPQGR
jgi:DNA polymerase